MSSPQKKILVTNSNTGTQSSILYDDLLKSAYANLSRIQLRNLNSNSDSNPTFYKYTKEQIVSFLSNPASNEKQLRDMSRYLYNISNYYRRLIQYFADMSTFSYVVVPYGLDRAKSINTNKFKKGYRATIDTLDRMNIPHEFSQAFKIAFRDDVYYGYKWESGDSFSLQYLDPDYCKISSKEDGCYNFAFNFSYFDSNPAKLANYPPEFETMYNQYKKDSQNYKWQELDSAKSICLKVNDQDIIPIPPFVSLFSALADIEDYRAISKNASEANNYKALAMEIPVDDKDGSLLIDYDSAKEFYDMMTNVLPPNIGAILTPMKISSWNFERNGVMSDANEVSKAESTMWAQAGVNRILFGGGDDPSASTLNLCTVNDQAIVFDLLRQVERWINRTLKSVSTAYKFRVKFLPVTQYNRTDMYAQYLKGGQYGLPMRSAAIATMGFNGTDAENLQYLENVILNLPKSEVPFSSSNTQPAEAGRPSNASEGKPLSDAGEVTADRQEA